MKKIFCEANAKINLTFKILGKSNSGFHYINSIIQSINLTDYLIFEKSKKFQFTGNCISPLKENLILKAKKEMEKNLNRKFSFNVHLQKTIPISAGLGGGSSDAAGTIFAINKLFNLNLSKKKLAEIGFKVGCDVPFFIYGGKCKVEGFGEKITPLSLKNKSNFYLILRPHKRLETKKIYFLYDKTGKNFFEIASNLCPDVKLVYQDLLKFQPVEIGMSGSGPSLFAGFKNYKETLEAAEKFNNFNGDIYITKPTKNAIIIKEV